MNQKEDKNTGICWLRRDLRLTDNHALYRALQECKQVLLVFIFDKNILDDLEDQTDRRVQFIFQQLEQLNSQLLKYHTSVTIRYGNPLDVLNKLVKSHAFSALYANEDYEPYALRRDQVIQQELMQKGIPFYTCTDHVLFKPGTIRKSDGLPYTIYTPFMHSWKKYFSTFEIPDYPSEHYLHKIVALEKEPWILPDQIGFKFLDFQFPPKIIRLKTIQNYEETRNFPAKANGTSLLGIHLRFGTLSIRKLIAAVKKHEVYLNELIWREFFIQILWHFPQVVTQSFKPKYDQIKWENKVNLFKAWCAGQTGYPLVDAGMRELNATGHMHNRVRMVTASFLCKHLLIDWRWGESYFADKLLDYELASNNGNWQWAAGTGCDAAPYFRIFNPITQQQKFDPNFSYIGQWAPEYLTDSFPAPIVDHEQARVRTLEAYKKALASNN